jgi:hypothetical protein
MKLKSLSRLLPLVVGSAAAGVLASMSPAHALTYNWSFSGLANTSGTFDTAADGTTITSWNGQVGGVAIANLLNAGGLGGNDNLYPLTDNGVSFNDSFFFYNIFKSSELGWVLGKGTTNSGFNFNRGVFDGEFNATAVPVPFDIPGGATIPAVGSLLALGAMRKAKKSIASKTRIANPVINPVIAVH